MVLVAFRFVATTLLVSLGMVFFAPSLEAAPSSLEMIAARGGVEPTALEKFFSAISTSASATDKVIDGRSAACLDRFDDTNARRTEMVECLTAFGAAGLHATLFEKAMTVHTPRMMRLPTEEMLKSLALLNYLEDLIRARMTLIGQGANWFSPGQGFLKASKKEDFKFEDGDIVLGLGNSSISSLISQVTNPPGRYSHAFMVRVRDGQPTTVESLIETGVEEFPWKHFEKDQYNTLTVLRWKNPRTRAQVTRQASDIAFEYAQKKIGYDTEIDLDSDSKMFCTELVVKAYMRASGESQSRLLPHKAVVRSEPAFRHVQNLGVTNRTFVAPGDLLNSDLFEIVGEYRRTEDLFKSWKLFLMGDVFLDRIDEGYVVTPGLFYTTMPIAVWLIQLLPSMFHEDLRLIPKSFGPASFAVTATVEKSIYSSAYQLADTGEAPNILKTSLWDYRTLLRSSIEKNRAMTDPNLTPEERRAAKREGRK